MGADPLWPRLPRVPTSGHGGRDRRPRHKSAGCRRPSPFAVRVPETWGARGLCLEKRKLTLERDLGAGSGKWPEGRDQGQCPSVQAVLLLVGWGADASPRLAGQAAFGALQGEKVGSAVSDSQAKRGASALPG